MVFDRCDIELFLIEEFLRGVKLKGILLRFWVVILIKDGI